MRSYLIAAVGLALTACGGDPECPAPSAMASGYCVFPGGAGKGGSTRPPEAGSGGFIDTHKPPERAGSGGTGGVGGRPADNDAGVDKEHSRQPSGHDAGWTMNGGTGGTMMSMVTTCGNGLIDPSETCDGDCPTSCDDRDACTEDSLLGSADECTASCEHKPRPAMVNGDGCCVADGLHSADTDCSKECNAATDCPAAECFEATCEGGKCGAKPKAGGDCGTDGVCQVNGSCKPKPRCGDGKVDAGETCDGNCPKCDDGNACTTDTSTGSAATCDLKCVHTKAAVGASCGGDSRCDANAQCKGPACGDGVVDPGEVCDGNCPSTCSVPTAECETSKLSGTAAACSAKCERGSKDGGTLCWDKKGACDGMGECIRNIWYMPCWTSCGTWATCENNICTVQCTSDNQCGLSSLGRAGRCVQGWCEQQCASNAECSAGQVCAYPGTPQAMCRPKTCSKTQPMDCPSGQSCQTVDGHDVCVPPELK